MALDSEALFRVQTCTDGLPRTKHYQHPVLGDVEVSVMKPGLLARGCCTTPAAMGFWAAMFVLIYGVGLLLRSVSPVIEPFGDTVILVALAAACVINFSRHRTLHCGITGPLFVLGAVAAGLIEADAWRLDMAIVWGVILLGVGIAFVIEWRILGRPRDPNISAP
jgi:hypothetical protein